MSQVSQVKERNSAHLVNSYYYYYTHPSFQASRTWEAERVGRGFEERRLLPASPPCLPPDFQKGKCSSSSSFLLQAAGSFAIGFESRELPPPRASFGKVASAASVRESLSLWTGTVGVPPPVAPEMGLGQAARAQGEKVCTQMPPSAKKAAVCVCEEEASLSLAPCPTRRRRRQCMWCNASSVSSILVLPLLQDY